MSNRFGTDILRQTSLRSGMLVDKRPFTIVHQGSRNVEELMKLLCLAGLCFPACATLQISSLTPSPQAPQLLGSPITWTATATDSNAGPLTLQFNVAHPGGTVGYRLAKDFNVGTLAASTWTSHPFVWVPTGVEGAYQIEVVIKDFTSNESASMTAQFKIAPLVIGSQPVVVATANPLVALFSAPACASGSQMRVYFQQQLKSTPATTTNWANCHAPDTMTFEIAGMYPSTTYQMLAQTDTGGTITNGPMVNFTTGALPTDIDFPTFTPVVAAGAHTNTALKVLLRGATISLGTPYLALATDLSGNIIWYYTPYVSAPYVLTTRPLANGGILSIQDGVAWNPASQGLQLLR